MNDELEERFADLRVGTMTEIVVPGAPKARATAHRRRSVVVFAGVGVVVSGVLLGASVLLHPSAGGGYAAGAAGEPSSSASEESLAMKYLSSARPQVPRVMPEPTGAAINRAQAAGGLLADRNKTPTSISATNGVVFSHYENHMNDMPADTYTFHFFCVGTGQVNVIVKQGDSGNTILGQGTAICAAHNPKPLQLTIHQPTYGYLRISASGDARSNGQAGFAFEFLSATGRATFGPSGAPYSFSPTAGSALPGATSSSN